MEKKLVDISVLDWVLSYKKIQLKWSTIQLGEGVLTKLSKG